MNTNNNNNNNNQQFIMYEQLTINTNLDENYQPIQRQLNTPQRLDYFNNQFTDELGITVHREASHYIDNNNLIMIAPNLNELSSNNFINVTTINNNNNRPSDHQSAVVDFNNNCQNGQVPNKNESNDDEQDTDESQNDDPTYSQVEEEKGRAKPFKPAPVVSVFFFSF